MKSTVLDPCFFYKHGENGLEGLQVTQVDDTCGGGTNNFSSLESTAAKKFESNPRVSKLPIKFNGMWIDRVNDETHIHQKDYGEKIVEMKYSSSTPRQTLYTEFRKIRGLLSYLYSS